MKNVFRFLAGFAIAGVSAALSRVFPNAAWVCGWLGAVAYYLLVGLPKWWDA